MEKWRGGSLRYRKRQRVCGKGNKRTKYLKDFGSRGVFGEDATRERKMGKKRWKKREKSVGESVRGVSVHGKKNWGLRQGRGSLLGDRVQGLKSGQLRGSWWC